MNGQFQDPNDNRNVDFYQQPNAGSNGTQSSGKGLSVAGLVFGILGMIGAWIPVVNLFTGFFALLGLIFGAIGRKKSIAATGRPSGIATAGLVLGIIGTIFAFIGVICTVACAATICAAAEASM